MEFRLLTPRKLIVFSFQGALVTTSAEYIISALGGSDTPPKKTAQTLAQQNLHEI
jgi:hypothetical protein